MFDTNTVMQETTQGHTETQAVTPDRPLAIETPAEPSVTTAPTSLAWWDDMKYYWKQNARGNGCHLSPQDSYVDDVLDRADLYMVNIAKNLGDNDYTLFEEAALTRKELIELEDAYDTSGIEGNAVRREVLNRLIIARKICGVSAVSAEHRVAHEHAMPNGNVEKMKEDPKGFFASDVEKRERWGLKAIRLEYICKAIADGEVIPKDEKAFAALLAKRIEGALRTDAVDRGNQLKSPTPKTTPAKVLSSEELLALTA